MKNWLKTGLYMAILLCGVSVSVPPAQAQDQAPAGGGQRGGGRMMDPAARAARVQQELGLTDDVTAKIKDIYTEGTGKMQAIRGDSSLSQDDMRSKMMAIRQDESTKVKALLTPDQAAKYDTMQPRRGGGMGGPPPGGGAAPQQ
jgi:Spy/CpxP family protein refolding chaperone